MKSKLRYLLVLAISLGLAACGGSSNKSPVVEPPPPPVQTVYDVAVANGSFTTLVAALNATGLNTTLDNEDGTFTVFAPTDAAFAALGDGAVDALLDDLDALEQILLYHVIAGTEINSTAAVAAAGTTVEMANGQSVGLSLSGESLLVNVSLVITANVPADNGIIHVIDAVLMPPAERGEPTANIVETAEAAGSFTTLLAALTEANLVDVLANEEATFTVFAPTDAAFEALGAENVAALLADEEALSAVLLQHVVGAEVNSIAAYAANGTAVTTASNAEINVAINLNSRALTFGGATVTTTDIYTTNGIIHVIDAVVIGNVDLPAPPLSIVEVAEAAGGFTTLLAALEETGLNVTLDNLDGTFTVFAPTDAAFAALPEGTLEALLDDPETLSDILLYHVVLDAQVLADAAISIANSESPFVTMANGARAGLSIDEGLLINLSKVTTTNVLAANGVIHVIDKVMLPPAEMGEPTMNIVETAVAAGNFTTLVDVLVLAGLDDDLANEEATFTVFAPTDAAFAMIPEDVLAAIVGDIDVLTEILTQHVVAGAAVDSVTAFTLNGTSVETLSGNEITIEIVNGMLQVGGATVSMFDIYTTNGIIHVIDSVIVGDVELPVPPMSIVDVAASNPNFSILAAALDAADLIETLDNLDATFTVFAPTNAAFEALLVELDTTLEALVADPVALADILLYHVISGAEIQAEAAIAAAQGEAAGRLIEMANGELAGLSLNEALFINTSQVITPDVLADNGVIHAIDRVMLPPAEMGMPTMNIVQTAVDNGNFETLAAALTAAELIGTLSDPDASFTVFAPTDDAFALLPEGTVEMLLEPENQAMLTEILLQHVVTGQVDSVTAFTLNGTTVPTASGNLVSLEIVNGVLEVQGSAITTYDIYTTNGIIHVIDAVIVEAIEPEIPVFTE